MDKPNDSIGRRSRMKPQTTGKRIRLTERDLVWMHKLHEHGPLPTSMLHDFTKHLATNYQRTQNRLTDLFNEDNNAHGKPYLIRPPQQFNIIDARYRELAYDLSDTGKKVLKENDLWHEPMGRSPGPWWHAHELAKVIAQYEIDTLDKPDLEYIPGWFILKRANTTLRHPTTFKDPVSGKMMTKDLIPDALFGLKWTVDGEEYFRFHCVEVDRGTEPKSSSNPNRKSLERTKAQYEDYVNNSKFRTHLRISSAPEIAFINLPAD